MPEITINNTVAEWTEALDPKYRYIFIKGGRSSGKSHEAGNYLALRSFTEKDLKIVCLREVQRSIKRSSKSLVDDKIKLMGLQPYYTSIEGEIRKNSDDGLFFFTGMNDLTADNVKSLEGFKIAWFEEAQNASHKTLKTLRPTIRMDGSQLIFTWNPKFPDDPIDKFCSEMVNEPDCLVIHVNYLDNPFTNDVVKREVEIDKKNSPEDFDHIWLGQYDTSYKGHYYAKLIQQAEDDQRITLAPRKKGVPTFTAWDLGRADSTAIWVCQVVGLQPRIVDYYENNFEDLETYVKWINDNGYNENCYLPHDGGHERLGMKGSIKAQLREMGVKNIKVLKIMSKQAQRTLAKELIKEAYFDKEKCKEGLHALKHYRSKFDEKTQMFKELHDWSSHGSDAFAYLAQALKIFDPLDNKPTQQPERRNRGGGGSWMG